jgi:hypothetical protein
MSAGLRLKLKIRRLAGARLIAAHGDELLHSIRENTHRLYSSKTIDKTADSQVWVPGPNS